MMWGWNADEKIGELEFATRTIKLNRDEHLELDVWVKRKVWEHCGKVL